MGNVLVSEHTLTSIADAIRYKNGSSAKYKPNQMPEAIESIKFQDGSSEIRDFSQAFAARLMGGFTNGKYNRFTIDDIQGILDAAIEVEQTYSNGTKSYTRDIPPFLFSRSNTTDLNTNPTQKGLTIPEGYVNIGYNAFDCSELLDLTLPEGLLQIGDHAFANTYLPIELTIPSTVEYIGENAFAGCELTKVIFKGPALYHTYDVFTACNKLTDIYVPWSEETGKKTSAPWGATNATIHYNYTE